MNTRRTEMKRTLAKFATLMLVAVSAQAGNTVYNGNMINGPLASTQTFTLNVSTVPNENGINAISAQVIYSSVALAASTFKDGSLSTGTITVNTPSVLLAQSATDQITVPASSAILGSAATAQFTVIVTTGLGQGATAQITIVTTSTLVNPLITVNGSGTAAFLAGTNWFQLGTTSATAQSLASIINSYSAITGISAAWGGGSSNVVYCTATVNGTQTNSYSVTSSTYNGIITTTSFSGAVTSAYVTINGNVLTNGVQWTSQTTSSMTALSIANAINTYVNGVVASTTGVGSGVVYATATVYGTAGNSYTLTTSVSGSISVSSAVFNGGANRALRNQSITFNGVIGLNGYQWTDADGTSTGTAVSINNWLQTFSTIKSTCVAGTGSVIYATATTAGSAGNALTLASSTGSFTIASPTFLNGLNNATLTINGITLTSGVNFSTGTAAVTATSIASAIAANATLNAAMSAQAIGSVVTTTSTATGTASNYSWSSSTPAALAVSGTGMALGTNPAWSLNSPVINVSGHGFATGLGVWFSSTTSSPALYWSTGTAGATQTALAVGSTYYVIYVDTNNIELATTSTAALAGVYVTLVSSSVSGPHSYTLNPTATVATSTGETVSWFVSDSTNCATGVFSALSTNKYGISVPVTTISAFTYPNASAIWDLGEVDFQCLQLKTQGPSNGEMNVQAILNGRD